MKRHIWILIFSVILCLMLSACGKGEDEKAEDKNVPTTETVSLESEQTIIEEENAVETFATETKEAPDNSVEQIEHAEMLIDAIGEVTLDSKKAIDDARNYLDTLPNELLAQVENLDVWNKAELAFCQARDEYLDSQKQYFNVVEDKVSGKTIFYPKEIPFDKNKKAMIQDQQSYSLPCFAVSGSQAGIFLVTNYYADDWVFFTKVIYWIDGQSFSLTYNYNDINRGMSRGNIFENVILPADDNVIELLWKISNSNETIIRFQGENYHDDITVTNSEKEAIKNALTIYEKIRRNYE